MVKKIQKSEPFIMTSPDRCRVCYTCVRECPAKAIRITEGQAEVMAERCIGCGNCVRVCSQKAKSVRSSIPAVKSLLGSGRKVIACIAPSFPVDFEGMDATTFVGWVRALGFTHVVEVGFGADLVARAMRELLENQPEKRWISTACPAVFGYVKRYHPDMIPELAPVVSPMIATARVTRAMYGKDCRMVFIGPCISKKIEAISEEMDGEIDEVLTFTELKTMFAEIYLSSDGITPCDFDPPHAGKGSLFPIGRGLLEAAGIPEDLLKGEVISANGKATFIDAVMEFSSGDVNARFLDVLCCDGCIMGSGLSTSAPPFRRRMQVAGYARSIKKKRDPEEWQRTMDRFKNIKLNRVFFPYDQRLPSPEESTIREILARLGKLDVQDELNCGACGYDTCREHAIAIHKGLAEGEMCLPYTIESLHRTIDELNESNLQLANAKGALIQSEKMASMGQLAAGIAHEVNNPLGVVLMYSHILLEEMEKGSPIESDLKIISDHADRAKKIVAGLLHFARQNKVALKPVDLRHLIELSVNSVQIPENIQVIQDGLTDDPVVWLDQDQMIQVMSNLIQNAVSAMPDGGTLTLKWSGTAEKIQISVSDTGIGIPKENISKVFEPFFTTKDIGKGTGLGLSITYGIVKMHRGDIRVTSNADPVSGLTGTTFSILLPKRHQSEVNA